MGLMGSLPSAPSFDDDDDDFDAGESGSIKPRRRDDATLRVTTKPGLPPDLRRPSALGGILSGRSA